MSGTYETIPTHQMTSGPAETVPGPQPVRSNFVVATGRTRKAGYSICGGGLGVALSAFLPWVSIEGVESVHQSGGSVFFLLAVGGLLAYFGARVLQGRLTKTINVALWVLAGIDVAITLGLFAAQDQLNNASGGFVSVTPAIGFYLALFGFIASVVGTVLVQTVRRRNATASPSPAGH